MRQFELNRPHPKHRESIRGYMLRLVEANSISRMHWLARLPEEISILRQLIGAVLHGRLPAILAEGKPRTSSSDFDSNYVLRSSAKFCLDCFKEDRYWRSEWEHEFYVVCHIHRNALLDRCEQCSAVLSWKRPSLNYCVCGSELISWSASRGSQDCFEISECIAAFLFRDTSWASSCPGNSFWSLFGHLSITDFSALICLFDKFVNIGEEQISSTRNFYTDIIQSLKITSNAATMLKDWPIRFKDFLEVYSGYRLERLTELRASQPAYLRMVETFKNTDFSVNLEFVLRVFQAFIQKNWIEVVEEKNKWKNQSSEDESRFISGMMVSRRLNISPSYVNDLLRKNLIAGGIQISRTNNYVSRRVYIDRYSLENISHIVGDEITLRGIADLLGIPKYRLTELIAAKFIFAIASAERKGGAKLFSRKRILFVLTTLRSIKLGDGALELVDDLHK